MGTHCGDVKLLARVAAAYFDGLTTESAARRLGIARELTATHFEALEAVLILAAHELPDAVIPAASRLPAESVMALLAAIRTRLPGPEEARAFIAEHPAMLAPRSEASRASAAAGHDENAAPSEDAEQALAVLDFWASKWL